MRVTASFISYNQEDYVRAALQSVLDQDYPLEIIVSDDCSTDSTAGVIAEVLSQYVGPHQVRVRKGDRNLGVVGNQNAVFEMASGELIVLFEGDDISRPDRVTKLVEKAQSTGAAALSSYVTFIDPDGTPAGCWEHHESGDYRDFSSWTAPGCGLAFRRHLLEHGPISRGLLSGDIAIWLRAAFSGGMAVVPEPLVQYRRHVESVTARPLFEYTSPAAFRECCRRSLASDSAAVQEWTQIGNALSPESRAHWQKLRDTAVARLRLLEAVAKGSKPAWIGRAIAAVPYPQVRSMALRALALATVPTAFLALRRRRHPE